MKEPKQDKDKMPNSKPDENMGLNVTGHILIRDKNTGEVITDKRAAQ